MASIHDNTPRGSVFSVGSFDIPPSEMQVIYSDLDSENSFRSVTGEMQRDRICTKRKVECTWNMLTASELSALLNSVKCVFFSIRYYDPASAGMESMVAYVGDRTIPAAFMRNGEMYYKSVSMNFVEK